MAASVVLAPGLFSTRNGLPSRLASFCAVRRASRSVPPPAMNGTMIVTGREGYDWATAVPIFGRASAIVKQAEITVRDCMAFCPFAEEVMRRHCERSEAIQKPSAGSLRRCAPRDDAYNIN